VQSVPPQQGLVCVQETPSSGGRDGLSATSTTSRCGIGMLKVGRPSTAVALVVGDRDWTG
jgi:hypothetical protein